MGRVPSKMMSRLREVYHRYFPEREIYMRSQGAMRYVTLSPRMQLFGVAVLIVAVGAIATLSLNAVVGSDAVVMSGAISPDETRERDQRIRVLEERNRRLEAEVALFDQQLNDVLRQTSRSVDERANNTTRELDLLRQLEIAENRLASLVNDRTARQREVDELQRRNLELEQQLAASERAVEDRQQNFADFVSELETTTQERDDARETIATLTTTVDQLSKNIEDIRSHQELVLGQIKDATEASLGRLEGILRGADVDVDQLIEDIERAYSGEGGPFEPIVYRIPEAARGFPLNEESAADVLQDLRRANALSIALDRLPLTRPVRESESRISSHFGPRRHPTTGRWALHAGLDLAGPTGTPIYAPAAGKVVYAGPRGTYGNLIKIDHPFGYETRYAHLSQILVSPGDEVTTGQLIGRIGTTGRSTGPHLHYEIRYYDKPVNPWEYIKAGQDVL